MQPVQLVSMAAVPGETDRLEFDVPGDPDVQPASAKTPGRTPTANIRAGSFQKERATGPLPSDFEQRGSPLIDATSFNRFSAFPNLPQRPEIGSGAKL